MAQIVATSTDLTQTPESLPQDLSHRANRLTQLLYNEPCRVLESWGSWRRIAALSQPHTQKQPYEGWVLAKHLEECDSPPLEHVVCRTNAPYLYGTLLSKPQSYTRPLGSFDKNELLEEARQFLEVPYLWGGLTNQGIDCSGLIHLLYRAQGITLPRDAHDQCLALPSVESARPGDLVYLARSERFTHVILKISESHYLEAPETGKCVRVLKWGETIWEESGLLAYIDRPHHYKMVFKTVEP